MTFARRFFDAAEKLGMKVWLGTIHDSNFTDPANYTSQGTEKPSSPIPII